MKISSLLALTPILLQVQICLTAYRFVSLCWCGIQPCCGSRRSFSWGISKEWAYWSFNFHTSGIHECAFGFADYFLRQQLSRLWIGARFSFFYCRTLVEAVEAKNLLEHPGHWRIRPILADFFNLTFSLGSCRIKHIPRLKILLAHSLDKKAYLRGSSCSCTFLCRKASRCNSKMAFEAISFPMGKLLMQFSPLWGLLLPKKVEFWRRSGARGPGARDTAGCDNGDGDVASPPRRCMRGRGFVV